MARKSTAPQLKIIPLGGLGEIGKNMTVLEYNEDIIVIDCGLAFPDEEMPGIDMVIPDMSYLEQNAERLRAFIITHGHEDHIGAISYALEKFKVPVFGTKFTLALIEHKLHEHHVEDTCLECINAGDVIEIGCFKIEFIKVSHSIAGAVALAVTTPVGIVVHTGDFKVDYTPIEGGIIDLARFGELGNRGVLALMSESTNVERPGYTKSERSVGESFR
ncbi:MAG TPA: ribonuclease J, partial [Clostridiales bacterium]|nr:ribonuclease J [Clostridiales bacterium]